MRNSRLPHFSGDNDAELARGGLLRLEKTGFPVRIDGTRVNRLEQFNTAMFKGFAGRHPCIGARSVGEMGNLHLSIQSDMSTVRSAYRTLAALEEYYAVSDGCDAVVKTLALIYVATLIASQRDFEIKYWTFVQLLHDIDVQFFDYDPTVSSDPASDDFELSLAGRAVFTTTLNPHSERIARRYTYPAFVMNQLSQFQKLRDQGKFTAWQTSIRRDDALIDPSHVPNPILVEHGHGSSAVQLPGSAIDPCPFRPRRTLEEKRAAGAGLIRRAEEEGCETAIVEHLSRQLDLINLKAAE